MEAKDRKMSQKVLKRKCRLKVRKSQKGIGLIEIMLAISTQNPFNSSLKTKGGNCLMAILISAAVAGIVMAKNQMDMRNRAKRRLLCMPFLKCFSIRPAFAGKNSQSANTPNRIDCAAARRSNWRYPILAGSRIG